MRIVQQLATVFYSPFPALPAPQVAGLLPAPQIAGLLTAGNVPRPVSRFRSQLEAWAEQDAELAAFVAGAKIRIAALRAELLGEREALHA